jgi:replicative DNA helicase
LTATGWKPLGEIGSGDHIATAMRLPKHGKEMPERADLCRLLGSMVGAGTVEQKESAKHVPEWVFESGAVGACEFLAGYLSTNGPLKKGMEPGNLVWEMPFDTVSRRLANDIQALLLRIGVVASIDDGRKSRKATQPLYRITLAVAADNLKRVAEQVPARGKKGQSLHELPGQLPQTQTDPSIFDLPPELSAYLHEKSLPPTDCPTRRDQFIASKRNSLPRSTCLEWAERLDDPLLHEWATSDLLWEEVRSIEPHGEAETFDISVPEANNFLADGIVAHNSGELEQAADIVMFIHRDDYYAGFDRETGKSLSTRPKTADIIIAKHRNGPIGDVVLGFEASQTKFYNLDEMRMGVDRPK